MKRRANYISILRSGGDRLNSATVLYDKYGIRSELDSSGHVWFSRVGRYLGAVSGNDASWREVRQLMMDVEQNGKKQLQHDDRVIVTGDRQVLVLYPKEIRTVLQKDPDMYMKALKRGKSEIRYQANERR